MKAETAPLPERTRRYLDGPAVPEGQRNHELYNACYQLQDAGYTMGEIGAMVLEPATCRDGLDEREVLAVVKSLDRRTPRPPIRYTFQDRGGPRPVSSRPSERPKTLEPAAVEYDLKPRALPQPITDRWADFIRTAFKEGEGVCIEKADRDTAGREYPPSAGAVLSREEILSRMPEWLKNWQRPHDPKGVFIRINPMKQGKGRDDDVTAYRHALIEFDEISKEEQYALIVASDLPCTAVIDSGNRSIHAWVKVDAADRKEYDARVKLLLEHFKKYKVDEKNKNPSRFARLPGFTRKEGRQELLALEVGAKSFTDWAIHHQLDAEVSAPFDTDELLDFEPAKDPNNVLGERWLCRGGSVCFVAQAGIGKSTVATQAGLTWAFGRDLFGIKPMRPLKSLYIQAENDKGDMAEMLQGVSKGLGLNDRKVIKERMIIVRDTIHTGHDFVRVSQRLIDRHKPDLVWFDPLLAYIGDDVNQQKICSRFFRNWLNPIAESTGIIWCVIHHTPKPKNKQDREALIGGDLAYAGAGSAEIANWARAMVLIREVEEDLYELKLPKRGRRSGLKAPADYTDFEPELVRAAGNSPSVYLMHSKVGQAWEYADRMPESAEPRKAGRKPVAAAAFLAHVSLYDKAKPIAENHRIATEKGLKMPRSTFNALWGRWMNGDLTSAP